MASNRPSERFLSPFSGTGSATSIAAGAYGSSRNARQISVRRCMSVVRGSTYREGTSRYEELRVLWYLYGAPAQNAAIAWAVCGKDARETFLKLRWPKRQKGNVEHRAVSARRIYVASPLEARSVCR